jgi:predicted DNA-binding transcriptional regulator YafY
MSRASRLLLLLETLRSRRAVVTGAELARATGVSLRTLYRDIETLREQGVTVEGEAGTGYRVVPGWVLPPMMFTEDELEALLLGVRWVAARTDPTLAEAATSALSRIEAVLPADLRSTFEHSALVIGPGPQLLGNSLELGLVRRAIRERHRIRIDYEDLKGQVTTREVWPVALAFFDATRILAGWCVLREDFRHFRLDRIREWEVLPGRFRASSAGLLACWKEGLSRPSLKAADRN